MFQYEPFLRSIVYELRGRGGLYGIDDIEDLMQEARLEFILHLRRIADAEDIKKCRCNIIGALCAYWRLMAQLRIPKNRYHEEIRKVQCISKDDAAFDDSDAVDDDLFSAVEIRDFIDSLTPEEQVVVIMKLEGFKGREIIPVLQLGGEPQMSRMLKRVRGKLMDYLAQ